jgi:hypothetical protein
MTTKVQVQMNPLGNGKRRQHEAAALVGDEDAQADGFSEGGSSAKRAKPSDNFTGGITSDDDEDSWTVALVEAAAEARSMTVIEFIFEAVLHDTMVGRAWLSKDVLQFSMFSRTCHKESQQYINEMLLLCMYEIDIEADMMRFVLVTSVLPNARRDRMYYGSSGHLIQEVNIPLNGMPYPRSGYSGLFVMDKQDRLLGEASWLETLQYTSGHLEKPNEMIRQRMFCDKDPPFNTVSFEGVCCLEPDCACTDDKGKVVKTGMEKRRFKYVIYLSRYCEMALTLGFSLSKGFVMHNMRIVYPV